MPINSCFDKLESSHIIPQVANTGTKMPPGIRKVFSSDLIIFLLIFKVDKTTPR